jgi:hypothetical protein
MVDRRKDYDLYEFVVVAELLAKQLLAGCTARLGGEHSAATMAQMEVADGQVVRSGDDVPAPARQCEWQL